MAPDMQARCHSSTSFGTERGNEAGYADNSFGEQQQCNWKIVCNEFCLNCIAACLETHLLRGWSIFGAQCGFRVVQHWCLYNCNSIFFPLCAPLQQVRAARLGLDEFNVIPRPHQHGRYQNTTYVKGSSLNGMKSIDARIHYTLGGEGAGLLAPSRAQCDRTCLPSMFEKLGQAPSPPEIGTSTLSIQCQAVANGAL
eukprot:3364490-Amphidinium_carterae.1